MVTAFTIVCILFVVTNVAVTIKLSLGKPAESESPVMRSFICPYCENLVHGLSELDRALHVSCITKSKADLEAEKKVGARGKDNYHVTYDHYTSLTVRDGPWQYVNGRYHQHVVTVYRNGKQIEEEIIGSVSKALAKERADDLITIDKHLRASKDGQK